MTDFDKIVHLLMFGLLSGTVFFDNTRYWKRKISGIRLTMGSFLFPIVFSGLIEVLQEYLSVSRSGDWRDFLFNLIGAGIGWLICQMINLKLKSA